jgi:hypothetical protein
LPSLWITIRKLIWGDPNNMAVDIVELLDFMGKLSLKKFHKIP